VAEAIRRALFAEVRVVYPSPPAKPTLDFPLFAHWNGRAFFGLEALHL
jgi:hypothetical protein